MFQDYLIATAAAVTAGVILAVPAWIAARNPRLRQQIGNKPWVIASLIGIASAFLSTVITYALLGISLNSLKIQVDTDKNVDIPQNSNVFLGDVDTNKFCLFSRIVKNRGDPQDAATATITKKPDHWEAASADMLSSTVTCYKISVVR